MPLIRLLLVLVLLPGCALVDRAAHFTGRTVDRLVGREPPAPLRDPLYLHLQLAMLSDYVVTQLVQHTEEPLSAAKEARQRQMLLQLRLDYASAVWNAASGPNPYANAIDLLVTFAIGQKQLERSVVADVLGPALRPTLGVLQSAQHDTEKLVRSFLDPAQYQALQEAIARQGDTGTEGHGLGTIDLEKLLGAAGIASSGAGGPTSLLGILGMDPFAGLDPATREIGESRQFGERLLFNLQRLPFLIRLNGELLANDVARELGLDRMLASLERASTAMTQAAQTASAFPDQLDQQRVRLVSDLRSEADRLGTLAREYRGAFEAASTTAATADQAFQTFGSVMARFETAGGQTQPARPFDITEYSRTAATIGETAASLSMLLGQVERTLDSPGVAHVSPQLAAALDDADERGRRLLYTAFALAAGLILLASLAVIVTATILRHQRVRHAPGHSVRGPSPRSGPDPGYPSRASS